MVQMNCPMITIIFSLFDFDILDAILSVCGKRSRNKLNLVLLNFQEPENAATNAAIKTATDPQTAATTTETVLINSDCTLCIPGGFLITGEKLMAWSLIYYIAIHYIADTNYPSAFKSFFGIIEAFLNIPPSAKISNTARDFIMKYELK